jgi:predicted nucleotidyltransferase
MCDASKLQEIEKQVVAAVRETLGDKVDQILLYGSFARGDFDAESDIDIMVIANVAPGEASAAEKTLIPAASRIDLDYDVVLSLCVKDSETFYYWANVLPFYKNVLREGVPLVA